MMSNITLRLLWCAQFVTKQGAFIKLLSILFWPLLITWRFQLFEHPYDHRSEYQIGIIFSYSLFWLHYESYLYQDISNLIYCRYIWPKYCQCIWAKYLTERDVGMVELLIFNWKTILWSQGGGLKLIFGLNFPIHVSNIFRCSLDRYRLWKFWSC